MSKRYNKVNGKTGKKAKKQANLPTLVYSGWLFLVYFWFYLFFWGWNSNPKIVRQTTRKNPKKPKRTKKTQKNSKTCFQFQVLAKTNVKKPMSKNQCQKKQKKTKKPVSNFELDRKKQKKSQYQFTDFASATGEHPSNLNLKHLI